MEGLYPDSLDALWRDKKYLIYPPRHADVFIFDRNFNFGRAHWHYNTAKIKHFSSREQADDSGGWGYVNDPRSPQRGTVFVNCTHPHWKSSRLDGESDVPWNLLPEPSSAVGPR